MIPNLFKGIQLYKYSKLVTKIDKTQIQLYNRQKNW